MREDNVSGKVTIIWAHTQLHCSWSPLLPIVSTTTYLTSLIVYSLLICPAGLKQCWKPPSYRCSSSTKERVYLQGYFWTMFSYLVHHFSSYREHFLPSSAFERRKPVQSWLSINWTTGPFLVQGSTGWGITLKVLTTVKPSRFGYRKVLPPYPRIPSTAAYIWPYMLWHNKQRV
jgi:hypothetical protein